MSRITCPACDTVQHKREALLGSLGRLTHYRCRYCGAGFSKTKRAARTLSQRADARIKRCFGPDAR